MCEKAKKLIAVETTPETSQILSYHWAGVRGVAAKSLHQFPVPLLRPIITIEDKQMVKFFDADFQKIYRT